MFEYGTGLMGATKENQNVTITNIHLLPPGSVVRNIDGSRIIHLHDNTWLYCSDNAWQYGFLGTIVHWLDEGAVLCHLSAPIK